MTHRRRLTVVLGCGKLPKIESMTTSSSTTTSIIFGGETLHPTKPFNPINESPQATNK
jgi:hypothetical protein